MDTTTNKQRPTLYDPQEWAIIKSIYFHNDNLTMEQDPIERLERQESKQRILNNNSR
jgi:hypothetical protein